MIFTRWKEKKNCFIFQALSFQKITICSKVRKVFFKIHSQSLYQSTRKIHKEVSFVNSFAFEEYVNLEQKIVEKISRKRKKIVHNIYRDFHIKRRESIDWVFKIDMNQYLLLFRYRIQYKFLQSWELWIYSSFLKENCSSKDLS